MTIEGLKELKTQTKEIANAIFDAVDWSADVCALINAEIERQTLSKTDDYEVDGDIILLEAYSQGLDEYDTVEITTSVFRIRRWLAALYTYKEKENDSWTSD